MSILKCTKCGETGHIIDISGSSQSQVPWRDEPMTFYDNKHKNCGGELKTFLQGVHTMDFKALTASELADIRAKMVEYRLKYGAGVDDFYPMDDSK